jgi:putative DNA primase/helicase
LIKQLTGGDVVQVDQKYKERLQFRNRAKLVFALNELPIVRDYSAAYFKRLIILNTPNTFRPGMDKYDPNLTEKITTEEVKSALLNKAIEGLKRLNRKGWQFTECPSSIEKVKEYQVEANLIIAFLDEMCVEKPGKSIVKQELYELYDYWSRSNNYHPFGKRKFLARVRDNPIIKIKDSRININGKRVRVFENIDIKLEAKKRY